MMANWKFEHKGTLRAVRSKMARIKKSTPAYFIRRQWRTKSLGGEQYVLQSSFEGIK